MPAVVLNARAFFGMILATCMVYRSGQGHLDISKGSVFNFLTNYYSGLENKMSIMQFGTIVYIMDFVGYAFLFGVICQERAYARHYPICAGYSS